MQYIANDGTTFDNEKDCKRYETSLLPYEEQKKLRMLELFEAIEDMQGFIDTMIEELFQDFPELAEDEDLRALSSRITPNPTMIP